MASTVRTGSSVLLKVVGLAAILGGVALLGATLIGGSGGGGGGLATFLVLIAGAGLLIVAVGGALLAVGLLLGRTVKRPPAETPSCPEEQQLRDSLEFLASRREQDPR